MALTSNTSFLGVQSMPADDPRAKTMIKIDHVSMVFNIASEQLNSLKEYAIALSRRELRFKEFYALDDVSFDVKQGDVFGILGTNGSGKSTILKIIAGVLDPTYGTCTVEGNIAPLIELGAGFDLELTARENIFLNGALLGYSKKFIQQHFGEIVDFAEVRDFLDMPMKNYSSGMVARIAFAIATVIIPDVLIVDEVLSVGDFMFQQKCERRIQTLIKEHGVTVLIVSHNSDQIERLCNKAVWIEKGHLRTIGAAKEVCRIYRAVGGRLGTSESEATVLDALANCNPESEPESISLYGENRYGTAVRFATFAETGSTVATIANADTARANYIANSLAGLANAMPLTVASDFIPDTVSQELRHLQPEHIVVVGTEQEVSPSVLDDLAAFCPNAAVERVEAGTNTAGIEAYRLGEHIKPDGQSWSKTITIAMKPYDAALVLLGGYLFNEAIPVFFLEDDDTLDALRDRTIAAERCIVLADENQLPSGALNAINPELRLTRFHNEDPFALEHEVNDWLEEQRGKADTQQTLIITSPYSDADNYCLGPLVGRLNAAVKYADPINLDSLAGTIRDLKACEQPTRLIFIGNDLRYNAVNKLMFEKSLRTLDNGNEH